jgi:hypothetical protein
MEYPRTVWQKVVTGQFSFQGFNSVYRWSCKEYALAIRVSLLFGEGRWFVVGRREVFTRTGRIRILLSNSISLVYSGLEDSIKGI